MAILDYSLNSRLASLREPLQPKADSRAAQ